MDILGQLLTGGSLMANTPGPTDDFWYQPYGGGAITEAGMRVNSETAQKISAWYRGRDILATVLAMLPLSVYLRLPDDGGSEPATDLGLYDVLHNRPNSWQDSFQWRRQKMFDLIDHGWSYDWIVPTARGVVGELHPIKPWLVTPKQIRSGPNRGRYIFHVRDEFTAETTLHTQDEIFYLRGAEGKGILHYARTSIGTALATEGYAAGIFGRGTMNGGYIKVPGTLDGDAGKRMAVSFLTKPGEWHIPKVMEQGAEFIESKMTPEDAQMLLSRKFSIDDMARWLGVTRQLLENSDPSFGNAEQFWQTFLTISMGNWLSLFEFGINGQLVIDPCSIYAEFKRDAITRANFLDRANGNVLYVNAGIRSADEIRGQEGWNKRGGKADELREPQNITGKPAVQPKSPKGDYYHSDQAPTKKAIAIANETAARLLRKEIAAVQKAAVRHASDLNAFNQAVTTFYGAHAALVSASLQMSQADAEAYCDGQARQIVSVATMVERIAALELWNTVAYAAGVAAIALEDVA